MYTVFCISGVFVCTDRECNIILGSCQEFLHYPGMLWCSTSFLSSVLTANCGPGTRMSILDYIGTKDDESGGDNWSYKTHKAPVKSSPPTNKHPTFYRWMPLPVAQPTASKHWREVISNHVLRQNVTRNMKKWRSNAMSHRNHQISVFTIAKVQNTNYPDFSLTTFQFLMPFLSLNQQCQNTWRENAL